MELGSEKKLTPEAQGEREAIWRQVERILAHRAFAQSTRCSKFIRYVIEKRLRDDDQPLKERTIGVEVFGRDADYDNNEDTVVRHTANDVRKRLAQYYEEPRYPAEIRIALPPGSYLPEFHFPAEDAGTAALSSDVQAVYPPIPLATARPGRRLATLLAAMAAAVLISVLALTLWPRLRRPVAQVDTFSSFSSTILLFWKPIIDPPNPVLLCVGELKPQSGGLPGGTDYIAIADTDLVMRLGQFLSANGKFVQLKTAGSVSFSDLRQGSTILVGGFENPWTLRATDPLRFHFVRSPDLHSSWIEDRKNPSHRDWVIGDGTLASRPTKDYVIVARFVDADLKHWVLVVAGLGRNSTGPTYDVLVNSHLLVDELEKRAPRDWATKNIEAVFSVPLVEQTPGPFQLEDVEIW
jgi:hypothetical protein